MLLNTILEEMCYAKMEEKLVRRIVHWGTVSGVNDAELEKLVMKCVGFIQQWQAKLFTATCACVTLTELAIQSSIPTGQCQR